MTNSPAEALPDTEAADQVDPAVDPAGITARLSLADPPTLRSGLSAAEVLDRLDRLSRRGRLPGYHATPSGGFKVALFAEPIDRELIATIEPDAAGVVIRFRARMKRRMPAAFAATIVVSIWPGVHLVDSLIPASWGWWPTWTWYMPLVILPIPATVPGMLGKSRRRAEEHLAEQVERIAGAIDAAWPKE